MFTIQNLYSLALATTAFSLVATVPSSIGPRSTTIASQPAVDETTKKTKKRDSVIEPIRYELPDTISKRKNKEIFNRYCIGDVDSTDVPKPNYRKKLVRSAMKNLKIAAETQPDSILFYRPVANAYELDDLSINSAQERNGYTLIGHKFLTALCGQFKDRATMIEAKLKWLGNLYTPTSEMPKDGFKIDYSKNIWSQFSARFYQAFIDFSKAYFDEKEALVKVTDDEGEVELLDWFEFGDTEARPTVPAHSVCETKMIIGHYVAKGKPYPGLEEFEEEYEWFKENHCPVDPDSGLSDDDYIYVFRGDSNFKPRSPEPNIMLWYGHRMMDVCYFRDKVRSKFEGQVAEEDCQNYFKYPFASRWNAARAATGAWLLHSESAEAVFNDLGLNFSVWFGDGGDLSQGPFGYFADEAEEVSRDYLFEYPEGINQIWARPDMGLNSYIGLGEYSEEGTAYEFAYWRISNLVERHTGWEMAGVYDSVAQYRWNDFETSAGDTIYYKQTAGSPLQANSYEISRSDEFTQPGMTIFSTEPNTRKRWMLIFKVAKNNLYTTESLHAQEAMDFDRMWFDETSFGVSPRSDYERAFDRMGVALEYELDSIMYLGNVSSVVNFAYPEDPRKMAEDPNLTRTVNYVLYHGGHTIDSDGYLSDFKGNYIDTDGNVTEEPVLADEVFNILYPTLIPEGVTVPLSNKKGWLVEKIVDVQAGETEVYVDLNGKPLVDKDGNPVTDEELRVHISAFWNPILWGEEADEGTEE